ncbi:MAG: hypothetical protein RLZZ410_442, partial [Pseudomonadota bacterium]
GPGYYVGVTAASTQTAASLGYFVPDMGSSGQIAAPVGRYVSTTGASAATAAELGRYVSTTGATATTAAGIGHYVSVTGASIATAAPLGRFVAVTGASAATLAGPGYYVNTVGASAQISATPGYYVSTSGATTQTAAPEGYFVNGFAAAAATPSSFSYIMGQLASTAEPLINDGAAGSSLPSLALDNKTIRIIRNLTSARSLDIDATDINVNPGVNATLSGNVSGPGSLVKSGSGLLNLTGNVSIAGDLIASQGVLQVDTNLANRVIVSSGGALQGSGQINNLVNRGTVSIGGAPGSIRVTGNYSSEPNSTLIINATPSAVPLFQIDGQAALAGNLSYNLASGSYSTTSRYTVLQANGGIVGDLNLLPISTAGYTIANRIDSNSISFELTYRDLSSIATTPNNFAIGSMLDQVKLTASGDLASVVNTISSLSSEDADLIFGRLTANQILGYAWAEQQKFDLVTRTVANRLNSYSYSNHLNGVKDDEINGWVVLQGMGAKNSSRYLPSEQSVSSNGITVGADYKTNNEHGYDLWGASLSAINSNIGIKYGGIFTGTTHILQGYGKKQIHDYSLDYSLAYGFGDAKQSRQINLINSSRMASSNISNNGFDIFTRLSKYFSMGNSSELRPYAGVGYRTINIEDYKETGSQSLNLAVNSIKASAKTYQVGLKYGYSTNWKGYLLKPSADFSVRGQVASKDVMVQQSFIDGSGSVAMPGNMGSYKYPSVTLSLDAISAKNLSMNIMLRSDKQSDFWIWGTQLGIKYRW